MKRRRKVLELNYKTPDPGKEIMLDVAEVELVQTLIQQIQRTQAELRGALALKVKQSRAEGMWDLSPCGTKLVRQG